MRRWRKRSLVCLGCESGASARRAGKGKAPRKLARSAGASPAQVRPSKPPGSERCVRRQQCRTRSVHSGYVGCVIELRNALVAEAEAVLCSRTPHEQDRYARHCHSAGVGEHITRKRNASEPGRSRVWPSRDEAGGPHREGEEPKPMMHGGGTSGEAIVAMKPANKAERSATEPGEPRAEAEGNARQASTGRIPSRGAVSQGLERIRQAAREREKERFTSLLHHISVDLLGEAFGELKRNAAPGVDGLTCRDYEADLERNLADLHARVHRGAYRALPSRRVYIPKPDGRQRPLAVAALEDKIVQRATVAVLNAIYEEDFLGFSYGFRPGRGAHD